MLFRPYGTKYDMEDIGDGIIGPSDRGRSMSWRKLGLNFGPRSMSP